MVRNKPTLEFRVPIARAVLMDVGAAWKSTAPDFFSPRYERTRTHIQYTSDVSVLVRRVRLARRIDYPRAIS